MVLIKKSNYSKHTAANLDDQIPLMAVRVNCELIENVGSCTVSQKYCNKYSVDIEALYVFNLARTDVITSMTLQVGNRAKLRSVIQEKSSARQTYNEAKSEGKSTCLLERLTNGAHKVSLGNLRPGEEATVEFTYLTVLPCEDGGRFRFVLPTNIAPQYRGSADKDVKDILASRGSNAPTYSTSVAYRFEVSVRWQSANGILEVKSLTDNITVESLPAAFTGPVSIDAASSDGGSVETASPGLDAVRVSCSTAPSRGDFNLFMTTREVKPSVALYAGPPETGSTEDVQSAYAMVTLRAPSVVEATPAVGKEFIFVVDRSGSMSTNFSGGWPENGSTEKTKMCHASDALSLFLESLTPADTFNVVSFGSTYRAVYSRSVAYTNESKGHCLSLIANGEFRADMGGTEIFSCLADIFDNDIKDYDQEVSVAVQNKNHRRWTPDMGTSNMPQDVEGAGAGNNRPEKIVVLLTDGQVSNTSAVTSLCARNAHISRVFAVGIGGDADRHLVEGVSSATNGLAAMVVDNEDLSAVVVRMLDAAGKAYCTDVTVALNGVEESTADGSPLQRAVDEAAAAAPHALYANDVLTVFRRLPLSALNPEASVKVTCRQRGNGAAESEELSWTLPLPAITALTALDGCPWIQQLYAADALRSERLNARLASALSIGSSVMSEHTAFVVVDQQTIHDSTGAPLPVSVPQHCGTEDLFSAHRDASQMHRCLYVARPPSPPQCNFVRSVSPPASYRSASFDIQKSCPMPEKYVKSNTFSQLTQGAGLFSKNTWSDGAASRIMNALGGGRGGGGGVHRGGTVKPHAILTPPTASDRPRGGGGDGSGSGFGSEGVGVNSTSPSLSLPPAPTPQAAQFDYLAAPAPVLPGVTDVEALLKFRDADGSFHYSPQQLQHLGGVTEQSFQAMLSASALSSPLKGSASVLFNLIVYQKLVECNSPQHKLIIRHLKNWLEQQLKGVGSGVGGSVDALAKLIGSVELSA